MTIGDHIRKKRTELRLTQLQVARLIGVEENTVTYWEKHRSQPAIHCLPQIIQFLGYIPFELKADSLGEQIKLYRKIKGISQENFAKQISVDPCTLARWERNRGKPSKNFLKEDSTLKSCLSNFRFSLF